MDTTLPNEVWDLLILVDATSSMYDYLASLRQSLPQILSISGLTNCFERIGLMAYRDYCDQRLIEWSGWRGHKIPGKAQPDLVAIASKLEAIGGGDWPEAMKTGLAKCHSVMREDAKTFILFYADAHPHMRGAPDGGYDHRYKEEINLRNKAKYDGQGGKFVDWVSAAKTLSEGKKKAQFMAILNMRCAGTGVYEYLAAMTGGSCLVLKKSAPRVISELSVELLLAWMGVHKPGAASVPLQARLLRYKDISGIEDVEREQDSQAQNFFSPTYATQLACIERIDLDTISLPQLITTKPTPLQDFGKTYKESEKYRAVVVKHLREIIDRDVSAMSLNPVFGSLWRVFCTDRQHPERQELLDLFGRKIDAISNADEKARMKSWLEESYDYTAEVASLIESVDETQRFPCVCLDPTLAFEYAQDGEEDETAQPITAFRRDELLEIGRSCDYRVLRRLGRILTRLTFIESAAEMPAHLADTTDEQVPKMPLALASREHKHEFWRVLLHIVVPGTMLAARAAAVLAALSIRMGVKPLNDAAVIELKRWKSRWNDLEVPETWNSSCLSLLLDADNAYKDSQSLGPEAEGLLLTQDRRLFQTLVEYKMLEANLQTDLTAQVGWTPQKTTLSVGPLTQCRRCKFLRSVTMMASGSVCGLCAVTEYENKKEEHKCKSANVSETDDESTNAYWYECAVPTCRAQYVVYNVDQLNVRPKCHYCREGKQAAPVVECGKCLSRMIWPDEYRTEQDRKDWICVACQGGRVTIINVDTTAAKLREENDDHWLLRNERQKLASPFNGRTLFHIASSAAPLDDFAARIQILPTRGHGSGVDLHIKGKLVRNPDELLEELYSWVSHRRTERGTCSLCFSDFKKTTLVPACGRAACHQKICPTCAAGWYGLNRRGHILNVAAITCPFCRRRPAPKTLMKFGLGVSTVSDLDQAWADRGAWIYAWCGKCDHARPWMERVCAHGAPAELTQWVCEACVARPVKGVRTCPVCGVLTEKVGGCDHITCTMCESHWCWMCGEQQELEDIYRHMEEVHIFEEED